MLSYHMCKKLNHIRKRHQFKLTSFDFEKCCLPLGECSVTQTLFQSCHHGVVITKGASFKKIRIDERRNYFPSFVLCKLEIFYRTPLKTR